MRASSFLSVSALTVLTALAASCGAPPRPLVATPTAVEPAPTAREVAKSDVPPPGTPKPLRPAEVFSFTQKSGLRVVGIASPQLPIVTVRVVVRAGQSAAATVADAKVRAGLPNLVAELCKDGGAGRFSPRALADRVDALGAELGVEVGPDRAVFSLSVTSDKLDDALELLGAVVGAPRFDAAEFGKLRAREIDRVRQARKGSGTWMARAAMYRELFGDGHPYADVDATEDALRATKLADAKAFWKSLYVASNVTVVVAGDVRADDLASRLDQRLSLSSAPAPSIPWTEPPTTTSLRVVLARKPDSKQADVLLGTRTLARGDARWPELALAVHALGGGMASRLFVDVREKQSLAYSTTATARELAHGGSIVALYAGTQTPLAGRSAQALLGHLQGLREGRPIEAHELAIAQTSLETGFVFRLETLSAVAGVAVDHVVLGLPGKDVYAYVDGYRSALRAATLDAVRAAARTALSEGAVLSVAGDPALAKVLRRFGPVKVVDPEASFATVEDLAADPTASLELGPPAK